jgi:hypothetical protein
MTYDRITTVCWCFVSVTAGVRRQPPCGRPAAQHSTAVHWLTQTPAAARTHARTAVCRHVAVSLGATDHVRILPQLSFRANRSAADSRFVNYRYVTVTSQQHTAQLPGGRLAVSTRKVLRPVTSAQVFLLGFPVSKSKCSDGSQHSKLPLHASHVALPK